MSRCEACGKHAEKTPDGSIHQGHNLGCQNARSAQSAAETHHWDEAKTQEAKRLLVDCAKDGCTEPRAESRGPRPAKFCEAHKTNRSK